MRTVVTAVHTGTDFGPLLDGLPDETCQCPHWGYVMKGRLHYRYPHREETPRAGDVYRTPAGHAGVAEEDIEFLEFVSPEQHQRFAENERRSSAAAARWRSLGPATTGPRGVATVPLHGSGQGGEMPHIRVNDTELFYETDGRGDPLVFVHGSWDDHSTWQHVAPRLAESFRVVTYDRRGHSLSERPSDQGSRREDEDDLAALLSALDCAPAYAVGNSFGGSIVLGLTARRPELVSGAIAHEPPLLGIVADAPEMRPVMQEIGAKVQAVLEQLERGDIPGGTRRFVEEIALGPGAWEQIPAETREVVMANASTFVDEQRDPAWADLDLSSLARSLRPALLTNGDQSPQWYRKVIAKLEQAMEHAEVRTLAGAGHVPHLTHPGEYADILTDFINRSRAG